MEFRPNSQWQIFDTDGHRKYPDEGERRRFLAAADRADPGTKALAYLLISAGCRISEALELTPERLDPSAPAVIFRTLKRRRLCFRRVPVSPEVMAMLDSLARKPGELLWPMHRVTAWRHMKELFGEARVTGPMACCRGLRHGFGIRAASKDVLPNLIQKWMGHAYPTTTAIYLDAVGPEERRFAERMW